MREIAAARSRSFGPVEPHPFPGDERGNRRRLGPTLAVLHPIVAAGSARTYAANERANIARIGGQGGGDLERLNRTVSRSAMWTGVTRGGKTARPAAQHFSNYSVDRGGQLVLELSVGNS